MKVEHNYQIDNHSVEPVLDTYSVTIFKRKLEDNDFESEIKTYYVVSYDEVIATFYATDVIFQKKEQ